MILLRMRGAMLAPVGGRDGMVQKDVLIEGSLARKFWKASFVPSKALILICHKIKLKKDLTLFKESAFLKGMNSSTKTVMVAGTSPRVEEFYRKIGYLRIAKTDLKNVERGVRLYCEMFRASWLLQIRGPLGIGPLGMRDSKQGIIASAHLNREELVALRDSINAHLAE